MTADSTIGWLPAPLPAAELRAQPAVAVEVPCRRQRVAPGAAGKGLLQADRPCARAAEAAQAGLGHTCRPILQGMPVASMLGLSVPP